MNNLQPHYVQKCQIHLAFWSYNTFIIFLCNKQAKGRKPERRKEKTGDYDCVSKKRFVFVIGCNRDHPKSFHNTQLLLY